jgi:hypothetical protein
MADEESLCPPFAAVLALLLFLRWGSASWDVAINDELRIKPFPRSTLRCDMEVTESGVLGELEE